MNESDLIRFVVLVLLFVIGWKIAEMFKDRQARKVESKKVLRHDLAVGDLIKACDELYRIFETHMGAAEIGGMDSEQALGAPLDISARDLIPLAKALRAVRTTDAST